MCAPLGLNNWEADMRKALLAAVATVLVFGLGVTAQAQTPGAAPAPQANAPAAPAPTRAQTAQQQRMGACSTGAGSQHLAGQERQKFMSDCLAGRVPATPPAAASASARAGTPAQQAQRDKMRTCNADAATRHLAGAERRTFMSTCLAGG